MNYEYNNIQSVKEAVGEYVPMYFIIILKFFLNFLLLTSIELLTTVFTKNPISNSEFSISQFTFFFKSKKAKNRNAKCNVKKDWRKIGIRFL